jgi:hypothetical protein
VTVLGIVCLLAACDGKDFSCSSSGPSAHLPPASTPEPLIFSCVDPDCDEIKSRSLDSIARGSRFAVGVPDSSDVRVEVVPPTAASVDGNVVELLETGSASLLLWVGESLRQWANLQVVQPVSLYGTFEDRTLHLAVSGKPEASISVKAYGPDARPLTSYLPVVVTVDHPSVARVEYRADGRWIVAAAPGKTTARMHFGSLQGAFPVSVTP